jgi:two-component system sensor histidine kinase MprB
LASVTAAVATGQTQVLATSPTIGSDRGPGGVRDGRQGGGRDGGPDGVRDAGHDERALVAQIVTPDGSITPLGGRPVTLPVPDLARAMASPGAPGQAAAVEVVVGRDTYRELITPLGGGRGALQVAVDIDQTQRVLAGMANQITWISLVILLGAAAVGWLLARSITRRLVRLAGIAEEVSALGRVDREVPVDGRDEVGRLSASFNRMLGRLAAAREAQDRLVQDAAHELRTPLTSLRTNASVLRRFAELSPESRERLVDDVQGETRELSHLVDELVELALSGRSDETEEPVEMAAVGRSAVERVQRRTGRRVRLDVDGSVVRGRREAIERAISNLLENAAKFDKDGSEPIELRIHQGTVTVAHRGPGIDDGDAARVFDRFYRADRARSLPGSGLGLAIVRDTAETHGGTVFAGTRPGGGAAVGFALPADRLLPDSKPDHVEVSPRLSTVDDT